MTAFLSRPPALLRAGRLLLMAAYVGAGCALLWLWRQPWAQALLSLDALSAAGQGLLQTPLGPLAVLGGYVVAVFLAVPVAVLVTVGVLVFGPLPGAIYAMAGMLSGATLAWGVGRLTGPALLRPGAGGRLAVLQAQLQRRGLWAVVAVRVLPVAPFLLVNVTAGALGVRLRDYVLGSFLGLLPGTVGLGLFMDRLVAVWRAPGPAAWASLAGIGVGVAALLWWTHRRLGRPST
ncbi:MAG: TVP38/TMEM64 family protein [Aquabacterium sp.]